MDARLGRGAAGQDLTTAHSLLGMAADQGISGGSNRRLRPESGHGILRT